MRRRFVGVVMLAVVCAALGQSPATADVRGVDFTLDYDAPVIAAGGRGVQTFTVGNSGKDSAGPATLTFATPIFVSVARGEAMPAGCRFLYGRPDAGVPEVVQCDLPPLRHGDKQTVRVPLAVDSSAPSGSAWGEAVVVPSIGSSDVEAQMRDNLGPSTVIVAAPVQAQKIEGTTTDLYLTTAAPAVTPDQSGIAKFTIGNRGPTATSGPVRLVMATPPLVKVDPKQPLPAECGFLYDNPAPSVPQIIRCTQTDVPAGTVREKDISLIAMRGAPLQTIWGIGGVLPDVAAGSTDVDSVLANNLAECSAQIIG